MRLAILTVLFGTLWIGGQEWGQWRGPKQDGVVPAGGAPTSWPASFARVWSAGVGEGYSSPVSAGGLVFVHSRRDPAEVLKAVRLDNGKVAWERGYPAPYAKNQYATKMMKGPNATPLAADGRIYTLGTTGILTAWKAVDGTVVWRNDYSESVSMSRLFCGTSASPMMQGGSLIVQVGSDAKGGRVIALDSATGKERWALKGEGPGYASPVTITVDGIRQIVTLTNGSVIGIDPRIGDLLWSIPFKDEWHENIVTPLWTGSLLIVSGTRQGTHAFTLKQADGAWRTERAWSNTDVPMYMSTPVLDGGTLYGFSNKKRGFLFALDVKTGAVKWSTDGREGDNASLLLTPEHIVCLTSGSRLQVLRRNPSAFEEVRRYELSDSETWGTPILLPDGLIFRDRENLVRFRLSAAH